MPPPGRLLPVQKQHGSLEDHLPRRRPPRGLHGREPYLLRILYAGSDQIRRVLYSSTLFTPEQLANLHSRYEYFKNYYANLAGPENAKSYNTGIFLAASASAEFFADIFLCPFEAVKVRMQTTIPAPANTGAIHALSAQIGKEGFASLFRGLVPLWGRQIPYTMMKFASFETIVAAIYKNYLTGPKEDYGKGTQTAVSFVGGYLAGILCAVVSHPSDVMVSKLNQTRLEGEGGGAATKRIFKEIGMKGLWNGLGVRIVMIGTLTGAQWLIYDSFKVFMGLPTTGGH